MNLLKMMPHWSWNEYVYLLRQRGYDVRLRCDKEGVVRGYVLAKGNAKYKASELGYGRKLTAKNIENTWSSFHQGKVDARYTFQVARKVKPSEQTTIIGVKSKSEATLSKPVEKPKPKIETYSEWQPDTTRVSVSLNDGAYDRFVPKDVSRYFEDEFDYRFVGNWKELTNLAIAYFTMLAAPEVSVSGGGGSTGNDLKWGRDPREDEMEWAHRCAQAAIKALGKQARYGRRR